MPRTDLIHRPSLLVPLLVLAALVLGSGVAWVTVLAADTPALDGANAGTAWSTRSFVLDCLKLAGAGLIGVLITGVQRYARRRHVVAPSVEALEQAQVLLTMAGALMMMLVGNSLAHAFGIAGAASIVRFRTPVEDPRDVTVLFLLMGLGMAAGMGAASTAIAGSVLLAIVVLVLHRFEEASGRSVKVKLVASGPTFPLAHVHAVFARHNCPIEPLEVTAGKETAIRFRGQLRDDPALDDVLERISDELLAAESGLKEVAWEPARVH